MACKLLIEGSHFGEISMLFQCKRTASIWSRNYNTIACLSKYKFNELVFYFPDYRKCLLKSIYKYKYSKKTFIGNVAKRVEYL